MIGQEELLQQLQEQADAMGAELITHVLSNPGSGGENNVLFTNMQPNSVTKAKSAFVWENAHTTQLAP